MSHWSDTKPCTCCNTRIVNKFAISRFGHLYSIVTWDVIVTAVVWYVIKHLFYLTTWSMLFWDLRHIQSIKENQENQKTRSKGKENPFDILGIRFGRRDTENILIYWKNFTSGHSFKVSVFSQHLLRHQAATIVYHTLSLNTQCALDARFLHSFSCCWQDGSSPTFIELDRRCLSGLFCIEQVRASSIHFHVAGKMAVVRPS